MAGGASFRGRSVDKRFEMIEARLADMQTGSEGVDEMWWELWELSKRVIRLKC